MDTHHQAGSLPPATAQRGTEIRLESLGGMSGASPAELGPELGAGSVTWNSVKCTTGRLYHATALSLVPGRASPVPAPDRKGVMVS